MLAHQQQVDRALRAIYGRDSLAESGRHLRQSGAGERSPGGLSPSGQVRDRRPAFPPDAIATRDCIAGTIGPDGIEVESSPALTKSGSDPGGHDTTSLAGR